MDWFLAFALKSLLVAGGTLLLLQLMRRRSAADRSLIAHLGLGALILLPLAALALPALEVAGPTFLAQPAEQAATAATPTTTAAAPEVAPSAASFPVAGAAGPPVADIDWGLWAYLAPAALLILLTLIALIRLIPLKARASVLVEPHWLTALAHAQRRMGFKNGTALLTSDDIRSPISWGVLRPVILLNKEATEARDEAEAIIAHELAHVARLDWAKLLLARVTVAIFWFNPLVWLLAREAHQLREEAADDTVLGADIEDTDYARLLVGVARHECRGLLIGAHGVAPGKNSLARRVRRVLDAACARAPGGWRWSAAAGFFAAGMAVPVAALQFVAPAPAVATAQPAAAPAATDARPAAAAAAAAAITAAPVEGAEPIAPADADHDVDVDVDVDVDPDIDIHVPEVPAAAAAIAGGRTVRAHERIEAVSLSGGGQVVVRHGRSNSARVLRGAGNVSAVDGNVAVSCHRDCGNFLVEVTTSRLEALAVQGGGVIRVADPFPAVPDLALAIVGGGRIDARSAPAASVAAATQGGGTILTTAGSELAASTTGGGEIRYWGTKNVATSVQGGGRIIPGG